MVKLDSGNVLLTPCQRRQLTTCLKRVTRLGDRIGDFVLTIALRQVGRVCEMIATVHDAAGDFICRIRQQDWRYALRELSRDLACQLRAHRQMLAIS